ncbi:hypothetical protein V2J79_05265 [Pseudomonas alliivorans]|nr:hypothetical protein [Pseudomonas alliivorans]
MTDAMKAEFVEAFQAKFGFGVMAASANDDAAAMMGAAAWAWQASREVAALEPVVGDQLPPVGSKVQIHLGSLDAWVDHTVAGYYVWGDLGGNDSLSRVFVRVRDESGYLNARLLKDIRPIVVSALGETVSVPKELLS